MSGALPYLHERRKFIVIALRARERARTTLFPCRRIAEWRLNFRDAATSRAYGN